MMIVNRWIFFIFLEIKYYMQHTSNYWITMAQMLIRKTIINCNGVNLKSKAEHMLYIEFWGLLGEIWQIEEKMAQYQNDACSMDRLCILSNKKWLLLKVDLQLTTQQNHLEKVVSLDLQKKVVLRFKRDIQMIKQECDLDIFPPNWIYKRD